MYAQCKYTGIKITQCMHRFVYSLHSYTIMILNAESYNHSIMMTVDMSE